MLPTQLRAYTGAARAAAVGGHWTRLQLKSAFCAPMPLRGFQYCVGRAEMGRQ